MPVGNLNAATLTLTRNDVVPEVRRLNAVLQLQNLLLVDGVSLHVSERVGVYIFQLYFHGYCLISFRR